MMGWTEAAVGASSLWHFGAAFQGWRRFHAPPSSAPKFPTAEEHAKALEFAKTIH